MSIGQDEVGDFDAEPEFIQSLHDAFMALMDFRTIGTVTNFYDRQGNVVMTVDLDEEYETVFFDFTADEDKKAFFRGPMIKFWKAIMSNESKLQ